MGCPGFVSVPHTVWLTSSPSSPGQSVAEPAPPGAPGKSGDDIKDTLDTWTAGFLSDGEE